MNKNNHDDDSLNCMVFDNWNNSFDILNRNDDELWLFEDEKCLYGD